MLIKNESRLLKTIYGVVLLACFIVLVLARLPEILTQGGRLWAEEGVVYFYNAWTQPWWQAWFAIHTGYINFIAGFGTWLGLKLGGVAHAPLVTVLVALLVQALAPLIILTHDFPWRRSYLGCLAAVAFCALPPVTGEVWLNTITSQFHFALAAALILAAPASRGILLAFDAAVIAVGVLSGPATSFLVPLFVLRWLVTRRRGDLLICTILLAGFFIQTGTFLTHVEPARNGHLSLVELMAAVSLHVFSLSFAGYGAANALSNYFLALHARHEVLWPGILMVAVIYGVLVWGVLSCGRHKLALALLLAAHAVFAFVSFDHALYGDFTSVMSVVGEQRYAFVSMVLTGLITTGCACAASGLRKRFFMLVTLCLLVVGSLNFRAGTDLFANGPAWAPQMAQWRDNPQMVLSVWPNQWPMQLPPRH